MFWERKDLRAIYRRPIWSICLRRISILDKHRFFAGMGLSCSFVLSGSNSHVFSRPVSQASKPWSRYANHAQTARTSVPAGVDRL